MPLNEQSLQVLSVKSLDGLEDILGGAGEAIADIKLLFSLAEKFDYSLCIQFDASVVCGLAYYTGINLIRKGSCELYVVVGDMTDCSPLMEVITFLLVVFGLADAVIVEVNLCLRFKLPCTGFRCEKYSGSVSESMVVISLFQEAA